MLDFPPGHSHEFTLPCFKSVLDFGVEDFEWQVREAPINFCSGGVHGVAFVLAEYLNSALKMGRSNFWPRIEKYNIINIQAISSILLRPSSVALNLPSNKLGLYGERVCYVRGGCPAHPKTFVAVLCVLGPFSLRKNLPTDSLRRFLLLARSIVIAEPRRAPLG